MSLREEDILRESGIGALGKETVRPSNRCLIPLVMRCCEKNPGLVLSPTETNMLGTGRRESGGEW